MPDNNGTIDAAVQGGNGGKVETLGDFAGGVLRMFITPWSLTRMVHADLNRINPTGAMRVIVYTSYGFFDAAKTLAIYGGAAYAAYSLYQLAANR